MDPLFLADLLCKQLLVFDRHSFAQQCWAKIYLLCHFALLVVARFHLIKWISRYSFSMTEGVFWSMCETGTMGWPMFLSEAA